MSLTVFVITCDLTIPLGRSWRKYIRNRFWRHHGADASEGTPGETRRGLEQWRMQNYTWPVSEEMTKPSLYFSSFAVYFLCLSNQLAHTPHPISCSSFTARISTSNKTFISWNLQCFVFVPSFLITVRLSQGLTENQEGTLQEAIKKKRDNLRSCVLLHQDIGGSDKSEQMQFLTCLRRLTHPTLFRLNFICFLNWNPSRVVTIFWMLMKSI